MILKTILHTYCFNIKNPEDEAAYEQLCEKLNDGRYWLNAYATEKNRKSPEAGPIELECEHLFSNQWNATNGFRVFDWYEEYLPYNNPNIKQGHWLEITEEMKEIRRNTNVCGYCCHQESNKTAGKFCDKCLGNAYLKQCELYLVRMLPVELYMPDRKLLTTHELAELLPRYLEAQSKTNHEKNTKMRANIQSEREKELKHANTKADGMLWLLDNNVNVDNVIYYPHTNKFSFGWRSPISPDVAKVLQESLVGFPFEHEIKQGK